MPFTWNILTLFAVLFTRNIRGSQRDPVLFHFSTRYSHDWSSHKTRSLWSAKKIRSADPWIRRVVVSAAEREIRGVNDETMTVGRKSEQRSLARRCAPRRRKLVSCFVAKVKTVTLLSALLVCERANAGAGQAELKHRRGWPPLARPQLHPIKHDWDTVRPLFSHTGPYKRVPPFNAATLFLVHTLPRSRHARALVSEGKNVPQLFQEYFSLANSREYRWDRISMRTAGAALKGDPFYAKQLFLRR